MAEQRFLSNSNTWDFDNAWQEMLNHATIKVMEAEKQKSDSEAEHLKRAASFQAAEQEVHIRDGERATSPIAGGAGLGASTLRAD